MPRAAVLAAEAVHPPAPAYELHREQAELRAALEPRRAAALERVVAELRRAHPEIPADFARSRGEHGGRAAPEWAVDPGGVLAPVANALLNEERARRVARVRARAERAQDLAGRLALASPLTAFQRAHAALAGTDLARHRHFEAQVDAFFERFGAFFNELWARNVRTVPDLAAAPSFHPEPEPAAAAWARYGRALLALLAFAAAALAFAARRLARYDAR